VPVTAPGSRLDDGVQPAVDRHFDASASYWHDVYGAGDLQGLVYRRRMQVASQWAAESVPTSAHARAEALDVGCGAGLMSLELARLGLGVTATDASAGMVATATALMERQGLHDRVAVRQADVHELPFADGRFGLVVALGLLPWLHDPAAAVAELARVLAPGGTIIVTADNRRRLNRFLEPREHPMLAPVRLARRRLRERSGWVPASAQSYRYETREVDALLAAASVTVIRRTTVGYGPFTVLGRPALPDAAGTRLHEVLQRAGERHPRLRGAGWHYVVAGVKADRAAGG
jgi:2-polyprenyl-3-methyl-5-hydroxy-6-metoxy-1,4-benzoquinol methylase